MKKRCGKVGPKNAPSNGVVCSGGTYASPQRGQKIFTVSCSASVWLPSYASWVGGFVLVLI